jgi:hypothetical protein
MGRRWLADLALYLPAVLIAFVIWLIAKQGDTETRQIDVPVDLVDAPANVEARVMAPVKVNLIFPKTFLKNVLEPSVIRIRYPADDLEENAGLTFQETSYPVLPSQVSTGDLPPSVRVLDVGNVRISAQLHHKTVPVKPVPKGTPASGYVVESMDSVPPTVIVTGPPEQLRSLDGAPTRTVDISGRNQSFAETGVELNLPENVKVVNESGTLESFRYSVDVEVTIDEVRETRVIQNVPIVYKPLLQNLRATVSPPATDLKVTGPRSLIQKLDRDSFDIKPASVGVEEPGATNKTSINAKTKDEALMEKLTIEPAERIVNVYFEEKVQPTPTPGTPESPEFPLDLGPLESLEPPTPVSVPALDTGPEPSDETTTPRAPASSGERLPR